MPILLQQNQPLTHSTKQISAGPGQVEGNVLGFVEAEEGGFSDE